MFRSFIVLCLALAVSSFPQSGRNLCGTDERGVARVAGDTWQEDCNRCKCTDNLLPGCTKRLCVTQPSSTSTQQRTATTNQCGTDDKGVPRVAGDTWQEDCNQCRCTENLVPGCNKRLCAPQTAPSTEQRTVTTTNLCGTDERGVARVAGDTWREDCNNCTCTENLLPDCTEMFCLPQIPNLCGTDERGVARVAGDTWQEDCNRCRCTDKLVPGCTKRFCGAFPPAPTTSKPTSSAPRVGGGGGGVMFPGLSGDESVSSVSCTDKSMKRREVGESWKEDCNRCSCGKTGVALCTQRFCINVEKFKQEKFLFTVDQTKNVENIVQCSSEGAQNCRAVKLNPEHLSSASPRDSQFLKLLAGSDVEMEVVRGPADLSSDTLSYLFRLTDGGEGTLTIRQSTSAAYGSFKPISGSVHYIVEKCQGDSCNVIYERDSNFFNNFED